MACGIIIGVLAFTALKPICEMFFVKGDKNDIQTKKTN
jgi:hypothetical protein